MTDIERLLTKRKATRGYLTRYVNSIDTEIKKEPVDFIILQDLCEQFDSKLVTLDAIQEGIETITEDVQLEEIIDEAFLFRCRIRERRLDAAKMVKRDSVVQDMDIKLNNSSVNNQSFFGSKASLPKINLPKFDGKSVTEWTSFYDQFMAVVHESDLPDVSKFVYLRSLLKGEASACVQGLSLSNEHYQIALDLLVNRYGRKEKLIFSHIQELMSINVPDMKNVSSLWSLQDKMLCNIRSLEKFGISGDQYGVILTPLVLSRLPQELRMEWAKVEGKESDLEYLLEFLKGEIQRRERSQTFSNTNNTMSLGLRNQRQTQSSSGSATALVVLGSSSSCHLCSLKHHTQKCWNWDKMTLNERHLKFQELGLCFRCVNKNCYARKCKMNCTYCGNGRHHVLLCKKKSEQLGQPENNKPLAAGNNLSGKQGDFNHALVMSAKSHSSVLMQLAKVPVLMNNNKTVLANVLFDTGSNKTYVSGSFVKYAKPKWEGCEPVSYVAFGSKETGPRTLRNVFSLSLKCVSSIYKSITATEVPIICAPLYYPTISLEDMTSFSGLNLTNCPDSGKKVDIDILIGLDSYWTFMKSGLVRVGDLVAQETMFGWILSGISHQAPSSSVVSSSLLSFNDITQADLHRFWDLETVGISDNPKAVLDPVLIDFDKSVTFSDCRYEVALPWKKGKQAELQNNERFARRRLDNLSNKLNKDDKLKGGYAMYFQEIVSGHNRRSSSTRNGKSST